MIGDVQIWQHVNQVSTMILWVAFFHECTFSIVGPKVPSVMSVEAFWVALAST